MKIALVFHGGCDLAVEPWVRLSRDGQSVRISQNGTDDPAVVLAGTATAEVQGAAGPYRAFAFVVIVEHTYVLGKTVEAAGSTRCHALFGVNDGSQRWAVAPELVYADGNVVYKPRMESWLQGPMPGETLADYAGGLVIPNPELPYYGVGERFVTAAPAFLAKVLYGADLEARVEQFWQWPWLPRRWSGSEWVSQFHAEHVSASWTTRAFTMPAWASDIDLSDPVFRESAAARAVVVAPPRDTGAPPPVDSNPGSTGEALVLERRLIDIESKVDLLIAQASATATTREVLNGTRATADVIDALRARVVKMEADLRSVDGKTLTPAEQLSRSAAVAVIAGLLTG